MDMTNKHDWGLVVAGVLLVVCGAFLLVMPQLAAVVIALVAGAAFLVSGVFDIVNYIRFRAFMNLSGWALAYGAFDIVLGILLLANPFVLAGALAWLIGAWLVVFGAFEIFGAIKIRKAGMPMWGVMLFSGIVGVVCGIVFFVVPAVLGIVLAAFVLVRGVSLVFYGWHAGKVVVR